MIAAWWAVFVASLTEALLDAAIIFQRANVMEGGGGRRGGERERRGKEEEREGASHLLVLV
jgi:hypothetical protein